LTAFVLIYEQNEEAKPVEGIGRNKGECKKEELFIVLCQSGFYWQ
jgi:hypothetical protein